MFPSRSFLHVRRWVSPRRRERENVPEMDLYGALMTDRIVASSFFAKFIYLSELIN